MNGNSNTCLSAPIFPFATKLLLLIIINDVGPRSTYVGSLDCKKH